eukprot:GHVL01033311.1.p1 GENE.GHVL01033311.1~~GHVL01033311.1.p1  ORF type:complete len:564 (-),score=112.93 GHVL01033311.1:40-1731(-)
MYVTETSKMEKCEVAKLKTIKVFIKKMKIEHLKLHNTFFLKEEEKKLFLMNEKKSEIAKNEKNDFNFLFSSEGSTPENRRIIGSRQDAPIAPQASSVEEKKTIVADVLTRSNNTARNDHPVIPKELLQGIRIAKQKKKDRKTENIEIRPRTRWIDFQDERHYWWDISDICWYWSSQLDDISWQPLQPPKDDTMTSLDTISRKYFSSELGIDSLKESVQTLLDAKMHSKRITSVAEVDNCMAMTYPYLIGCESNAVEVTEILAVPLVCCLFQMMQKKIQQKKLKVTSFAIVVIQAWLWNVFNDSQAAKTQEFIKKSRCSMETCRTLLQAPRTDFVSVSQNDVEILLELNEHRKRAEWNLLVVRELDKQRNSIAAHIFGVAPSLNNDDKYQALEFRFALVRAGMQGILTLGPTGMTARELIGLYLRARYADFFLTEGKINVSESRNMSRQGSLNPQRIVQTDRIDERRQRDDSRRRHRSTSPEISNDNSRNVKTSRSAGTSQKPEKRDHLSHSKRKRSPSSSSWRREDGTKRRHSSRERLDRRGSVRNGYRYNHRPQQQTVIVPK